MRLIFLNNFRENEKVIKELYELTTPIYIDNTAVLEREISHCNKIYLLENLDNINTFYLGLSGCHINYTGMGYAKYLYNSFLMNCKKKEIQLNCKILCWWTTASPIPFKWFNNNLEDCEPNINGDISLNGYNIFTKLSQNKFGKIELDKTNPFILKKVAKKTNYSINEQNRLLKIKDELNIHAFNRFQIDESNGDRFLMIGYAPPLEIVKKRLSGFIID